MLPDDEITSTEQLLTLIRNNSVRNDANENDSKKDSFETEPKKIDSESDHVVIGVDIRENSICLVKIGHSTKAQWKLIECRQNNPEEMESTNIDGDSIDSKILSDCIGSFLGNTKKYKIWTFASSEKADAKYILIPKVQEKLLTNTVYWSAKKEMEINEENDFFDFEIIGDITQKGIGKTAVIVYKMPVSQINGMKELFSNAGYPLTGISIPEFSTQNLLRGDLLSGSGDTVATLSIGNLNSNITIYRHGNLTLSRRIKACLNSMSESLVESIKESYYHLTQTDHRLSVDYARNLLLKNISGENSDDDILSEDEDNQNSIFEGIFPAVERLVRQIELTFQHYHVLFKEDTIKHIYIEGVISRFKPLNTYISNQLNITVSPLDVILPGIPQFSEYKTNNPYEACERFTAAVGLAMSDFQASAPNFLMDYREKERVNLNSRINKGIRIGLTIAVILCFCLLFLQILQSKYKSSEIITLKEKLNAYGPRVDQELILKEAARMKDIYSSQKKIAKKYLGLSTITELIEKNPDYIQLNKIRIDMQSVKDKYRKRDDSGKVIIEGTVFKEKNSQQGRDGFETSLANYMLSLENSPIFSSPSIQGKTFEYINRYGEVLIFELSLKIQSETVEEIE